MKVCDFVKPELDFLKENCNFVNLEVEIFEMRAKGIPLPELADKYLATMANENGMYDIELFESVICRTMDEYGEFVVTIPAIKFLSPEQKELRFNSDDIRKLKNYIMGD